MSYNFLFYIPREIQALEKDGVAIRVIYGEKNKKKKKNDGVNAIGSSSKTRSEKKNVLKVACK